MLETMMVQQFVVLGLTIASIIMSSTSKIIDQSHAESISLAGTSAAAVQRQCRSNLNYFQKFSKDYSADLKTFQETWESQKGRAAASAKPSAPAPGETQQMLHHLNIQGDMAENDEDAFAGEMHGQLMNVAGALGVEELLGNVGEVLDTAMTGVSFSMAVYSMSKSLTSHVFSNEDKSQYGKLFQIGQSYLAKQNDMFEQYCTMVKRHWENADVDFHRADDTFSREKAMHVATEMERAWRCKCHAVSEGDFVDWEMKSQKAYKNSHEPNLPPVGVYRQSNAGALNNAEDAGPAGERRRVMALLRYDLAHFETSEWEENYARQYAGYEVYEMNPPSKERKEEGKESQFPVKMIVMEAVAHDAEYLTDIFVLNKKCDEEYEVSSVQTYLEEQGYYKLEAMVGSDPSEYTDSRHDECKKTSTDPEAGVFGGDKYADIQQGRDNDHDVVIIYIKTSTRKDGPIPISRLRIKQAKYDEDFWPGRRRDWWMRVPISLYQERSWFSDRIEKEDWPWIEYVRDHAVVTPPAFSYDVLHPDQCFNSKPQGGADMCQFKMWLQKSDDAVEGYEAMVKEVFGYPEDLFEQEPQERDMDSLWAKVGARLVDGGMEGAKFTRWGSEKIHTCGGACTWKAVLPYEPSPELQTMESRREWCSSRYLGFVQQDADTESWCDMAAEGFKANLCGCWKAAKHINHNVHPYQVGDGKVRYLSNNKLEMRRLFHGSSGTEMSHWALVTGMAFLRTGQPSYADSGKTYKLMAGSRPIIPESFRLTSPYFNEIYGARAVISESHCKPAGEGGDATHPGGGRVLEEAEEQFLRDLNHQLEDITHALEEGGI